MIFVVTHNLHKSEKDLLKRRDRFFSHYRVHVVYAALLVTLTE